MTSLRITLCCLALLFAGRALAQNTDFDRAVTDMKAGRWVEARVLLESVVALNPKHHEAQNNLAVCLIKLKQFQKAADILAQLMTDQPDRAGSEQNLGVAHQGLGKTEFALGNTDRALKLFRNRPNPSPYRTAITLYNFGWLLDEQEQYLQSGAAYLEAVQLRPDYARAWLGLAIVYGKQARYKEAREALDKAWLHRAAEADLASLIETNRKVLDDLEQGRIPEPPVPPTPTAPRPTPPVAQPGPPPAPAEPTILGIGLIGIMDWWEEEPLWSVGGYAVAHVTLWGMTFLVCRRVFRPPLNRDELYSTALWCAGVGFLGFAIAWGFWGWERWLGLLVAASINASLVLSAED